MSALDGYKRVALAMAAASGLNFAITGAMAQDPSTTKQPLPVPTPGFNGGFDFAAAAQSVEPPTTKTPFAAHLAPGSYELIKDGFRRVHRTETVRLTREQIAEWNAGGKGDQLRGDRLELNTFTDYLPANWMQGLENRPPGARVDSFGNPIVNDAFGLPGWAQKDVDGLRQEISNWLLHLDNLNLAIEGRGDEITAIAPRAVAESYQQSAEELQYQRAETEMIIGNYFGQSVVRGIDVGDILPLDDARMSQGVVDSVAQLLHGYEGIKASHARRRSIAAPVSAYPPSIASLLARYGHSIADVIAPPPAPSSGDEGGVAGSASCYFGAAEDLAFVATVTGIGIWNGSTPHDDEQADVPIGFLAYFDPCNDGTENTQVRVSTNGYITFFQQGWGAGLGTNYVNVPIPSLSDPDGFAAPWWDDLTIINQGVLDEVVYKLEGAVSNRVLTVEYWSVSRLGGSTTDNHYFQVKLYEQDSSIEFIYGGSSADPLDSATIGVENFPGTDGDCGPNCGSNNTELPLIDYAYQSIVQSNDDCSSPPCVYDGDIVAGHNFGATGSDLTSCLGNDFADVWYRYRSPGTGTLTIDTCTNPGFDTMLSLHSSFCGAELDCDDDGCGLSLASWLSYPVTAGTEYWIRVAGYSGRRGLFTLSVNSTATIPPGDTCADTLPISIPGTGVPHTLANNTGCDVLCVGSVDEWLLWTAPSSGVMRATTCGGTTNFDTTLQVFSGPCASLTQIACNDDIFTAGGCAAPLASRVMWVADAGVTYRIRVGAFAGGVGPNNSYDLALNYSTCPADIVPIPTGNLSVDVNDLLAVVSSWGACSNCRQDFVPAGGDNQVDVNDLLGVITTWGACP